MENQTNQEVEEIEDNDSYYESAADSCVNEGFMDCSMLPTVQDFEDAFSFW